MILKFTSTPFFNWRIPISCMIEEDDRGILKCLFLLNVNWNFTSAFFFTSKTSSDIKVCIKARICAFWKSFILRILNCRTDRGKYHIYSIRTYFDIIILTYHFEMDVRFEFSYYCRNQFWLASADYFCSEVWNFSKLKMASAGIIKS